MAWEPTDFLEAVDESLCVFTRDGVFVYANASTARMFGKPVAELIGKGLFEEFREAIGTPFHAAFVRVQQTGNREVVDSYLGPWDRWFRNQIFVLDGRIHVMASDITEQKRGEVRLQVLSRASHAFAHAFELEPLLETIARTLAELVGDACVVRIVEDGELRPVAIHHPDPERVAQLTEFFAVPMGPREGISSHVFDTGEPLLIERLDRPALRASLSEARAALIEPCFHSVMINTLRDGTRRVGLVTLIRDHTPWPYTKHDLSLLQDVVDRASMAMSNARLYQQAQQERRRALTLANASRAFTAAAPSTTAILDVLAHAAASEIGELAVASLLTPCGTQVEPITAHADPDLANDVQAMLGWRRPIAGTLTERVVETRMPLRIDRVDPRAFAAAAEPEHRDMVRRFQPRSFLMVPIRRGHRVLGTITTSRQRSPEPYSVDDERFIEELADRAGLAIENVRMLDAERLARQSAERIADHTRRLQSLGLLLSHRLPVREVADTIVRESMGALGEPSIAIWLLEDDQRMLTMLTSVGYSEPARWQRFAIDAPIPLAIAVRTETPLYIECAADYLKRFPVSAERIADAIPSEVAAACLPLVSEGRSIGGISFAFPHARVFTGDERMFLGALANQCAQAIDRARLLEQERAASEAARDADRRKDEFLAMLGHELRNPLAPILTALELLRIRGETGGERERALIERQTRHLVRLVDDLLDISRITRGKLELRKYRVDLGIAIAQAVEMASPLLEQRNHHVSVAVPRGLVYVDGDEFRLAQVFQNLLTNAAKYTPNGGSITVRLTLADEQAVVDVEDNGVGIAPDMLARIFEPFMQGTQKLDRSHGGLGIGLTLVRSLAELHGGGVSAHSAGPGHGSRFTVRLPLSLGVLRDANRTPHGMIPLRGSKRRVLLVDDNRDAAEMLGELLRAAGHDVMVAFDGPSALGVLPGFTPDVVLLDIGLPVMDGYDLARKLRDALPSAPRLVAITGYGSEHDHKRSEEAGFEAHLVKPVQAEQVLAAVG